MRDCDIRAALSLVEKSGDTIEHVCDAQGLDYASVRAACASPEYVGLYKTTLLACRGRVLQRIIELERKTAGASERERGVFWDHHAAATALAALKVLWRCWSDEIAALPAVHMADDTDAIDALEAHMATLTRH